MRRVIAACMIVTVVATTAFGADEGYVLPSELSISLPANGKVQAEWLAPPLPVAEVRKAGFAMQRFRLDRHLATWMLHDNRTITNLATGGAFTVARPINDFIWLRDGALLLAGEKALGIIVPPKAGPDVPAKVPEVQFQPVIPLPAQGCRLATDGKDAIFAYGYDPEVRGYALFKLLTGFAGWQRLFVTDEQIADACFDGTTLSVAAGRRIHRLKPGDQKSLCGFNHPLEAFTGLACSPEGGLFFSTARGVGVVNGATIEFVRSNRTQIEVRDRSLYLFMPESLGVMRLNNIRQLLQPATEGRTASGNRPPE